MHDATDDRKPRRISLLKCDAEQGDPAGPIYFRWPQEASPKAFTTTIDLLSILEYESALLERRKIDWDLEIGRLVGNVEIENDQGVRGA